VTKKIAILSDSHGFIHPEIITLVAKCDIAIHAGDVCDETILKDLKPLEKLIVIAGNNDEHIKQLKNVAILELDGQKIVIEHGHLHGHHQPSHDSLRHTYPDAKVIIYGHTHKQVIDDSQYPWVINPGASGKIRNHGGPSCLVLNVTTNKVWKIKKFRFDD
jgi:putative phosphoesterase